MTTLFASMDKLVGRTAHEVFSKEMKTKTKVCLVVARPVACGAKIVPSNILADEEELEKCLK